MKKIIKKQLAYYDASTDTIHGCEPGTLSYAHEQGHQVWAKKGIEQYFQLVTYIFTLVFLPIAVSSLGRPLLTFAAAIPLILFLVSEGHAWWYALYSVPLKK